MPLPDPFQVHRVQADFGEAIITRTVPPGTKFRGTIIIQGELEDTP